MGIRKIYKVIASLFLTSIFGMQPAPTFAQELSLQQAAEIGVEAYVYFYPLILMDVTRKVLTNVELGKKQGAGPANVFSHMREFPSATFRDVVRPNFDTLYSSAWLDLTKEPMIITVPNTSGRYYLLPMLDMWSDVFAVPGKRTSGTESAHFGVVPPGWTGQLPEGVELVQAPTPFVWIIGRTQTNGPSDYAEVHKVQDGYLITPLSGWRKPPKPVHSVFDPTVNMKVDPVVQVNTMPAAQYFSYAAELMKQNPPHLTDWSILARIKKLGIEPGKSFDLSNAEPTIRNALAVAPSDGLKAMRAKIFTLSRIVNGWQMNTDTMGVYGNYYMKRAIVALVGLGANQPEDAIYPLNLNDADGQPLEGQFQYQLHFESSELPPVDAFWSLTMYDEEGFQVANTLNRFAIGDRDQLKYNHDGSLDIFIQNRSPGKEKESNWLPSPANGQLGITMRLYSPRANALDGRWAPPAIKRVN